MISRRIHPVDPRKGVGQPFFNSLPTRGEMARRAREGQNWQRAAGAPTRYRSMGDNDWLRSVAKAQRAQMSDAERKLWHAVRARRLGGLKFRRQHPIGPYVADFYCAEARLVVEVDGNHHGEPAQVEHDEVRDDWLTTEGLNVLRLTVYEVLENIEDVKERIWSEASGND